MIYKLKHHAGATAGFETEAPIDTIIEALAMATATVAVYFEPSADLSNEEFVEVLLRGLVDNKVRVIDTDKQYFGVEIDMFDLYESIAACIDDVVNMREKSKFSQSIYEIACAVYQESKEI
ncbi:hypothetical protein HCI99_12935 [Listeria booriae]|uniref:Uncharacterized protein n=1 Tax=Listeria booriae TaxID=1552123 RepID=A0A7X1CCS2_9LIST|nr:hypothetical protein [Listeria booriae]MBC1492723.1 hypothetical protein [Listeria booriae]